MIRIVVDLILNRGGVVDAIRCSHDRTFQYADVYKGLVCASALVLGKTTKRG